MRESVFRFGELTREEYMANPILVTGAAGRVGAVGRTVTELLLKQGKAVRAMVRGEDERAQALRDMGAEVGVGDLLDLDSMHRAIAGCDTMYFSMSVSDILAERGEARGEVSSEENQPRSSPVWTDDCKPRRGSRPWLWRGRVRFRMVAVCKHSVTATMRRTAAREV